MIKIQKSPRVLVCVTDQYSCERLIKAGKQLSDSMGLPLQVLSVQPASSSVQERGKALDYLYRLAARYDASMTIYYHDDSALMTAGHIKKYRVRQVVTGMPGQVGSGFVEVLHTLCPEVPITLISQNGEQFHITPAPEEAAAVQFAMA